MSDKNECMPANLDAERVVLGSVFTTDGAIDALRATVEPNDFSIERHRRIWRRMCELYDEGTTVDRITVMYALKKKSELDPDSVSYVNALDEGMPSIVNLDSYVTLLREQSMKRTLLVAAESISQRIALGDKVDNIREALFGILANLGQSSTADRRPISTREMIEKIGADQLLDTGREAGLRLPWARLNTALSGMRSAQMIVIGAYTGRGKTSIALQIATHVTKQGTTPLIWTMEMEPKRLFRRIVNQMTRLAPKEEITFEERERTREAVAWVYEHPIYFDAHSRTVPSFCASIRQVQAQREVGLVVVDYLQLIRMSGRVESRTREVGENSRTLKLAAMDFGIPFLVLSQFRRPNGNEPATIHSLKESGDIENDADVILLMNAPDMSLDLDSPVSVTIGKQREGPAGFDIQLMFHPSSQTFYSADEL